MSKNLQAYLKMDLARFPNQYAVFVDGKLIGTGEHLPALLKKARKQYPHKTPAVAKIPGHQTLILTLNVRY